jgi:hypothetical protein
MDRKRLERYLAKRIRVSLAAQGLLLQAFILWLLR